jgi:transcription initiation factor TFIIH subunit 4
LRLLFVEQSVPQAVVSSWVSQAFSKLVILYLPCFHDTLYILYNREHVQVVAVLSELRVWQETSLTGGLTGWILNVTFKKNMKVALLGG